MSSIYCLIGQILNQVKFMNTSTEHILLYKQSEHLADASGRIVDLMNKNGCKCALPRTVDMMLSLCLPCSVSVGC